MTAPAVDVPNGSGSHVEAPAERPRKMNPIKLRKMQERCQQLEQEVARAESEIREYEEGLATFVSVEETARLTGLLSSHRPRLEQLVKEWEELSLAVDSGALESKEG